MTKTLNLCLFTVVIALLSLHGQADSRPTDTVEPYIEQFEKASSKIVGMTELPIAKITAVEDKDGQIYLISQSGRYLFKGELYDVWEQKQLTSTDQIRYSIHHFDFTKLNLNPDEFRPITLGQGDQVAYIFSDPLCVPCAGLMEDLKPYLDDFKFKVFPVPVIAEQSKELTQKLYCNPSDISRAALLNHRFDQLAMPDDCDLTNYYALMRLADMVKVDAVPFVISPDNRISRGRPSKLGEFLQYEKKESGR